MERADWRSATSENWDLATSLIFGLQMREWSGVMRVNVAKLLRVEIDEDLDLQIKTLNCNNKFTWCFHKTKQV